MQILNWSLLKNPINWFTVILMLYLAAIAGTLILEGLGVRPATGDDNGQGTFGTITGASTVTAGAVVTGGSDLHATFSQNPTPGFAEPDLAVTYW